jgi:hypothetical protein
MAAPNPAQMEIGKLAIDPVRLDGGGNRIGPRLYTKSSDGQVVEFLPAFGTVAPLVSPVYNQDTLDVTNLADGVFYEYTGPALTLTFATTDIVQECLIYTTTNAVTFAGAVVWTGSGGPILPGGCVMGLKKLSAGNYLLFGDMTN